MYTAVVKMLNLVETYRLNLYPDVNSKTQPYKGTLTEYVYVNIRHKTEPVHTNIRHKYSGIRQYKKSGFQVTRYQ